jgi:hypothetical protein
MPAYFATKVMKAIAARLAEFPRDFDLAQRTRVEDPRS